MPLLGSGTNLDAYAKAAINEFEFTPEWRPFELFANILLLLPQDQGLYFKAVRFAF